MFSTTAQQLQKIKENFEQRSSSRVKNQTFVKLRTLDEECESMIALTMDVSDVGLSLLTYIPLPVGTQVAIETGENFTAIAEVADWEWDYNCDMARLGLQLKEKHGHLPIEA